MSDHIAVLLSAKDCVKARFVEKDMTWLDDDHFSNGAHGWFAATPNSNLRSRYVVEPKEGDKDNLAC
jgi:hypothetical protein